MGNRAIVIFANSDYTEFSPAVYLHWNGGPESIYAFLTELDRREVRPDQFYECARFVQLVGEYLSSNLSLGVQNGPNTLQDMANFDNGDNGAYVICREPEAKRRVRRFDGALETPDHDVDEEFFQFGTLNEVEFQEFYRKPTLELVS